MSWSEHCTRHQNQAEDHNASIRSPHFITTDDLTWKLLDRHLLRRFFEGKCFIFLFLLATCTLGVRRARTPFLTPVRAQLHSVALTKRLPSQRFKTLPPSSIANCQRSRDMCGVGPATTRLLRGLLFFGTELDQLSTLRIRSGYHSFLEVHGYVELDYLCHKAFPPTSQIAWQFAVLTFGCPCSSNNKFNSKFAAYSRISLARHFSQILRCSTSLTEHSAGQCCRFNIAAILVASEIPSLCDSAADFGAIVGKLPPAAKTHLIRPTRERERPTEIAMPTAKDEFENYQDLVHS